MLPRMGILAFGIALLCTSAEAVPCRDGSCQKKESEDRDASSIELKPMRAGDRSYGAWRMLVKDPPLGLSVKDELPSGLPKKDELPPGHRDELDWRGREWRKRVATLPDSHAESGSASLTDSGADRTLIFAATSALAAVPAISLAANAEPPTGGTGKSASDRCMESLELPGTDQGAA